MPEEASDLPYTFEPSLAKGLLEGITSTSIPKEKGQPLKLEEVIKAANKTIKTLKEELDDEDLPILESVADLVLGPLRLGPELKHSTLDNAHKEASARFQHTITHGVTFLTNGINPLNYPGGEPPIQRLHPNIAPQEIQDYATVLYASLNNLYAIAEAMGGKQTIAGTHLINSLIGIRNQTALVRTFQSQGYSVFLPEYAIDEEKDYNEVFDLDIREGVDFIVVGPDRKLLGVDASGDVRFPATRFQYLRRRVVPQRKEHVESHQQPHLARILWDISQRLAPTWESRGQARNAPVEFYEVKITLPGDEKDFFPFPPKEAAKDPIHGLSFFGRTGKTQISSNGKLEIVENPIQDDILRVLKNFNPETMRR